jgi:hypothetical protein
MPKKKKIRKVKVQKPRKPKKETKLQKAKKDKLAKFPANQLENLKKWLSYYEEHKKLPHSQIICSNCQMDFISLRGVGIFHAMKNFNNDIQRILTESLCKSCKEILNPKEVKEKAVKVVDMITREEMQARRDAISETLPKIDFHKTRIVYDLVKDKDMCKAYTDFSCHRPDIYLDYGCKECALQNNCEAKIKDVNRQPDDRRPKFKRFTTKAKQ